MIGRKEEGEKGRWGERENQGMIIERAFERI